MSEKVQKRIGRLLLVIPVAFSLMLTATTMADEHGEDFHLISSSAPEEANKHVHGSHPECPLPKTPLDVVRCAQEEHPEVKRAKLSSEYSQTLMGVAGQISNPELQVQSGFGSALGDQLADSQISLVQPIDLGGRRSARIQGAQAQQSQASADLIHIQANVIIETILKLHRLRQIDHEKELLNETAETFGRLISQHKARPALPPEQAVSLSVFKMALEDTKLKQSELFEEEREIEHYFHVTTGHGLAELKNVLPPAPQSWPEVQSIPKDTLPSPALVRATSDQELALSELKFEQAQSWPEFGVGPMVFLRNDGPLSSQLYGFQLNLAIPVFNINGAGRARAARGVSRAERLIALTRAEENHERAEQVRVYQSAVEALKNGINVKELEQEHRKSEALSARGLVSGPLLIESHRQRADVTKSRHGRELRALESLWLIYKFDGRIFKEAL